MATLSFRRASFKQGSAPAARRTNAVRVTAMQTKTSPAFAAAAAAVLLVSGPAFAGPTIMSSTAANIVAVNPQAELAAGPASKVKNAAENLGPRQGALAPDVEGQIRAGQPGKAREVAQRKGTFVAASKEDQASAAEKYPESQVLWRR